LQDVQHDEVGIDIVQKGLGSITDNDIAMASASGAIVVGFHVGMTSGAKKFAVDEDVIVEKFEIIYELIDFAKEKLELLLDAKLSYEKIGSLKVLAVFRREKTYVVTGGKVANGVMRAKAPVKLTRAGKMTGEGKITQLQKDKKGVAEVKKGSECGMKIEGDTDIEEGDVIECYEAVETDQKLEQ
jgi:translation initiation factor IF-2